MYSTLTLLLVFLACLAPQGAQAEPTNPGPIVVPAEISPNEYYAATAAEITHFAYRNIPKGTLIQFKSPMIIPAQTNKITLGHATTENNTFTCYLQYASTHEPSIVPQGSIYYVHSQRNPKFFRGYPSSEWKGFDLYSQTGEPDASIVCTTDHEGLREVPLAKIEEALGSVGHLWIPRTTVRFPPR